MFDGVSPALIATGHHEAAEWKERNNLKYIVLVHEDRESGGYWGECPELPGCFSQGETVNELMEHMKEAAELYLDEPASAKIQPVREIRELVL